MFYQYCKLLWLALLIVGTASVSAMDIHVLDANGAPLMNAVVVIEAPLVEPENEIAVMDQVDQQFEPTVLVVKKGQLVDFPNSDHIRHHVYSFSRAKRFEIKLYAGVPEAPLLFDQSGLVVLGCNIHDNMLGYIYVADTPYVGKTNQNGSVTIAVAPSLTVERITVWHPWLNTPESKGVILNLPAMDEQKRYVVSLPVSQPEPKRSNNTFGERFNINGN